MAESVSVKVNTEDTAITEPNNGFTQEPTGNANVTRVTLDPSKEPETTNTPPATELIAGKFKSQDDLVKAYKELESKLGTAPAVPTSVPPAVPASVDLSDYVKEASENGALSDASYQKLATQGVSKEIVDGYLAGKRAEAEQYRTTLFTRAGGKEQFDKAAEWARANLTKDEIGAIDKALGSGSTDLAGLAVDALLGKYTKATGTAPTLITGAEASPAALGTKPFADSDEMVRAMSDPRYATSPAYRKQIEQRLAASDILTTRSL